MYSTDLQLLARHSCVKPILHWWLLIFCKVTRAYMLATPNLHDKVMWWAFLNILYTCHHIRLLITNRSWILTIHKGRIFWKKNSNEKMFLTFKKWVKNIQTAGYNGACRVYVMIFWDLEIFWASLTVYNLPIIFKIVLWVWILRKR